MRELDTTLIVVLIISRAPSRFLTHMKIKRIMPLGKESIGARMHFENVPLISMSLNDVSLSWQEIAYFRIQSVMMRSVSSNTL